MLCPLSACSWCGSLHANWQVNRPVGEKEKTQMKPENDRVPAIALTAKQTIGGKSDA